MDKSTNTPLKRIFGFATATTVHFILTMDFFHLLVVVVARLMRVRDEKSPFVGADSHFPKLNEPSALMNNEVSMAR